MNIPFEEISKKSESWSATFTALILFIFIGLSAILLEIPRTWVTSPLLRTILSGVFPIQYIIYPILFFIGWIKGFPRWSYPYLGIVLLLSILMMNASTPGFLFGDELWKWRAWIPLLIISAVALLVTRSFQPLRKFFTNIKEDWTLLTFGLYGCLPVYAFINFDEMDHLYTLYFMVGLTVVMLSTVTLYMRSSKQKQRIITMLIGTLFILAISKIGHAMYWQHWYWNNTWLMVFSIMFLPAFIGIFQNLKK
ncbi:MAG: hypothetical protein V2J07_10805 [Anaerolineae bacterium]|jgi:hypothetical protein|nr:hypothetical protein [Anaerolineae bacterium]